MTSDATLLDLQPFDSYPAVDLEEPQRGRSEKRLITRSGFEYRFLMTPVGSGSGHAPVVVCGKDISPRGAGFTHDQPIAHRKVRLTADDTRLAEFGLGDLVLEIALQWCRFVEAGRYESGGRITRTTAPLF